MSKEYQVLVVEDEPGIRDNIEFVLQTEGYSCVHASNLAEARHAINQDDFMFVVLDIGLPDGNGFEFCQELRADSDVPIIILTARNSIDDRVQGLSLGADDYLEKPFSPRELLARMKAILRRVDKVTHGDSPLVLDYEKRTVSYFSNAVECSRYEFDLLAVLAQQVGRVFSRSDLMDRIWDDASASYDRTVDTHIKTIRAKLKAINPEVDAIITHRGLGYALREEW